METTGQVISENTTTNSLPAEKHSLRMASVLELFKSVERSDCPIVQSIIRSSCHYQVAYLGGAERR
jgi:hypothetical protein